MIIIHSPKSSEYHKPGHPESPERIKNTRKVLLGKYEFLEPQLATREDVLRAHSPVHIANIQAGNFYDKDTPNLANMAHYAFLSAGAAIEAVKLATQTPTFSFMRPPGHHACREKVMGFCYLNNAAIAGLYSLTIPGITKTAMLDIDNHHGNGTQEIVRGRKDILHVDLHKHPEWPGTGQTSEGNCLNYLMPHDTTPIKYLKTLDSALEKIKKFNPDMLIVSAGFDTFKEDPVGGLNLEFETYKEIGEKIKSLKLPTCSILEGGYNADALPFCILNYLQGIE